MTPTIYLCEQTRDQVIKALTAELYALVNEELGVVPRRPAPAPLDTAAQALVSVVPERGAVAVGFELFGLAHGLGFPRRGLVRVSSGRRHYIFLSRSIWSGVTHPSGPQHSGLS